MKHLYRFTPGIITLIVVLIFLGFKSPERSWDRVINSDGKGYYAYLPAVFIYHDLQFRFVEQYEALYYPGNRSVFKEFRNDAGEKVVNKYFPGLSVIWLPFFLFGHLMAWLERFPQDGYSLPYQYAIALSAIWFLYFGARWLRKLLLLFGSGEGRAAWITTVITLGTNLLFYTVVEPSMTHVYSFALVSGFALWTTRMFQDYQPKWFVKSLLALTLLFIIRPTNLTVVLLVPFLAGGIGILKATAMKILSDRAALIRGIVQALILLAVPVTLWYLQTGKFLVYSYGAEKPDFLRPHVLNILFSFNRGWFVYTPVALVAILGLIGLWRENRFRFWWMAAFLGVFIYVASCWWVWYYASKCGQRVFVDIYAVTGLLLLFLYRSLQRVALRRVLTILLLGLTGLSVFQFYQHTRWIFPPYTITWPVYRDAFFSTHREARVYLPDEAIAGVRSLSHDMETEKGTPWMNAATRNDTVRHSGNWSSKADLRIPYSIGIEVKADTMFTTRNRIVRVLGSILAPKEVTEATLVVDFQTDGRSFSYNQFILEEYALPGRWTRIETAWYVPVELPEKGTLKVYFYNPSRLYPFYVDDLTIDFISLKEEEAYRKLEGVLLPEPPQGN